jgi:hypothetical protein
MREGTLKPMELVKVVREAEAAASKPMERTRGEALLGMWKTLSTAKAAQKPRTKLTVQPVRSSTAAEVNGKTYDLVVIGGTPGGIACAVRGAREGLSVLLVQHNKHIGGMLTNGLMQWDALYGGPRSPVFNEYAKMIEDYYRETFGEGSKQHSAGTLHADALPDEPLRAVGGGAFVQPARFGGEEHHDAAVALSCGDPTRRRDAGSAHAA